MSRNNTFTDTSYPIFHNSFCSLIIFRNWHSRLSFVLTQRNQTMKNFGNILGIQSTFVRTSITIDWNFLLLKRSRNSFLLEFACLLLIGTHLKIFKRVLLSGILPLSLDIKIYMLLYLRFSSVQIHSLSFIPCSVALRYNFSFLYKIWFSSRTRLKCLFMWASLSACKAWKLPRPQSQHYAQCSQQWLYEL